MKSTKRRSQTQRRKASERRQKGFRQERVFQTPAYLNRARTDKMLGFFKAKEQPLDDLALLTVTQLQGRAAERQIKGRSRMTKAELVEALRGT